MNHGVLPIELPGKLGILGRYANHHRAGSRAFVKSRGNFVHALREFWSFTRLRLAM